MAKSSLEDVARAEDLRNLLQHIAWTDTIKPKIDTLRQDLHKLLVAVTLGQKFVLPSGATVDRTPEQIAGQIEGLNFIERLINSILHRGDAAFRELNNLNSAEKNQK